MAVERLCTGCKHYRLSNRHLAYAREAETCHALDGKQHPVTGGDIDGIEPSTMRLTLCGWGGKLWEKKQHPPTK